MSWGITYRKKCNNFLTSPKRRGQDARTATEREDGGGEVLAQERAPKSVREQSHESRTHRADDRGRNAAHLEQAQGRRLNQGERARAANGEDTNEAQGQARAEK